MKHKIKFNIDLAEVMTTPQPDTISIDGVEIASNQRVRNLYFKNVEAVEKCQLVIKAFFIWLTLITVAVSVLVVVR